MFTTTSHAPGRITVDVIVTDDSGGAVLCSASLYWLFDLDNELDYYYIELIDDVYYDYCLTLPGVEPMTIRLQTGSFTTSPMSGVG